MIITSDALVENIRTVLGQEIAPAVADDKWLASYLRSIDSLLPHLAALVEHEWPVLLADNADLHETLAAVAAAGIAPGGASPAGGDSPSAPASLGELRATNIAYKARLDAVIPAIHASRRAELLDLVRAYLQRSLERRLPIDTALGLVPF